MPITAPPHEIRSPSSATGHSQSSEQRCTPEKDEPKPLGGLRGFWKRWRLLIKMMIALLFPIFLETLDATVVASAQPQIASAFNSLDLESWVGTSYSATSTAFLLVFANLTNIFGRYATIQFALIVFAIGSALSTGAQNMPMLLAGRGISGVGTAALVTATRVIFADTKNIRSSSIHAIMISLLFSVGYSTGLRPVIGGALSTVSFRWIFAINLPISVASMILVFLLLRDDLPGPQHDPRDDLPGRARPNGHNLLFRLSKIDWIGSLIFVFASILILLGLNWGSTRGWDQSRVIITLVAGGILLLVFLSWELYLGRYEITPNADGTTKSYPAPLITGGEIVLPKEPPRLITHTVRMLPLYIFKTYNVTAICTTSMAIGMLLCICFYFMAIYFNIVAGYSSTQSGAQLLYFQPGLGVGFYLSMVLVHRLQAAPSAHWCWALGDGLGNKNMAEIISSLSICGISMGMTFGTGEMVARFAAGEEHMVVVVTLNIFFLMVGATVGLAQQFAVFESKARSYIDYLKTTHQISFSDAATITSSLSSLSHGGNAIDQLPSHLKSFVQDAYRYGSKWAVYSIVPWLVVGALPCLFINSIKLADATGDVVTEEHEEGSPAQQ
ncbi:major facilitator superfamily domain-containing protein [Cantharellus anzutake]|uniref:major facilitator superfamily domain-containing protein n=1 Tax=Cantharellus anzutake TaxID=1750568 RepID=UPI0019075D2C|nr:major facilitator superfamily domain-containing protein [Cantharellus anzutake]KAF8334319.1 major facilitator superfamily domain-containing protein [Cantharellus anzutake]